MATKAEMDALTERIAELEQQNQDLKAQAEQQPPPAPLVASAEPAGGAVTADLPASRPPAGIPGFDPDKPEVGQYVGHGATSIASSSGTHTVDPASGLIVGQVGAKG